MKEKFVYDEIIEYEILEDEIETCDLEVESAEHTFLANGISVSNSHSISYSMISYQCAWLFYHYPSEWVVSFLDKESDQKKERAVNLVKQAGFELVNVDLNKSGVNWEIDATDDKVLIQPLTSVKGLGQAAIKELIGHRPFNTPEEFLFDKDVVYSKLNKRAISALILAGGLDSIRDSRFTSLRHFWMSLAYNRPKSVKKFTDNIEEYKDVPEFEVSERINQLVNLTGVFPLELVLTRAILKKLDDGMVPPLGDFDPDLQLSWCIPREVIVRATAKGKKYYVVKVLDSTSKISIIRCWGVDPTRDLIHLNHPYIIAPEYNEKWGFSTKGSINRNWQMIG